MSAAKQFLVMVRVRVRESAPNAPPDSARIPSIVLLILTYLFTVYITTVLVQTILFQNTPSPQCVVRSDIRNIHLYFTIKW